MPISDGFDNTRQKNKTQQIHIKRWQKINRKNKALKSYMEMNKVEWNMFLFGLCCRQETQHFFILALYLSAFIFRTKFLPLSLFNCIELSSTAQHKIKFFFFFGCVCMYMCKSVVYLAAIQCHCKPFSSGSKSSSEGIAESFLLH